VLWQIDVMGGVMLEDGAELKVVTGLDPDNRTTGRLFHPPHGRAVRRTGGAAAVETTCKRAVSSSRGFRGFWVSAKGAVDDDLVQGALEQGELLIIELGDEQR